MDEGARDSMVGMDASTVRRTMHSIIVLVGRVMVVGCAACLPVSLEFTHRRSRT